MQFYFLSDHGGRKITSGWLTYLSTQMENNINVFDRELDGFLFLSHRPSTAFTLSSLDLHYGPLPPLFPLQWIGLFKYARESPPEHLSSTYGFWGGAAAANARRSRAALNAALAYCTYMILFFVTPFLVKFVLKVKVIIMELTGCAKVNAEYSLFGVACHLDSWFFTRLHVEAFNPTLLNSRTPFIQHFQLFPNFRTHAIFVNTDCQTEPEATYCRKWNGTQNSCKAWFPPTQRTHRT